MNTRKIFVGIAVLAVMLATMGVVSAYDNSVNLVQKDGDPNWNVTSGPGIGEPYGVLDYSIMYDGMMTYQFTLYDEESLLTSVHTLVVIYPELAGSGEWPQVGSVAIGNSGEVDISNLLGCVNDEGDYSGEVCGAKIWYIPTYIFDGDKFVGWSLENTLFEEDLIIVTEECEIEATLSPEKEEYCLGDEITIVVTQPPCVESGTAYIMKDNEIVGEVNLEPCEFSLCGEFDVIEDMCSETFDISISITVCDEETLYEDVLDFTVDSTSPIINEVFATPSTISLIGMLDIFGDFYCDPWGVLECNCSACRQTHSFGPYCTTLVVNTTDECIGVSSVTMDYSAIIYHVFANPIAEFSDEERDVFDAVMSELTEEPFDQCCETSYCRDICVLEIIGRFADAADIDFEDLVLILSEKAVLGDINIPIKVEDECGNSVTGSVILTIVDYQIPLKKQWNIRSVPITLAISKWGEITALGDGLRHDGAYRFDSGEQVFKKVTEDYRIKPLEAFYIHMVERDQLAILLERDMTAPLTRELSRGYNLIGTAILPFETMRADLCLKSIELTSTGLPGYTNVISLQQILDYVEEFSVCEGGISVHKWYVQKPWVYTVGQDFIETDQDVQYMGQDHHICKNWMDNAAGYWVYMENPDTLAGFTTTPVFLIDFSGFF